jgi:predicted nucleic acid-binding protein
MRFVDSNVFVYHLAGDPSYGPRAEEILNGIEKGEEAITSTLVIAQVCAYLKWKKLSSVIPVFIGFLQSLPSLEKEDTTFLDITSAYTLQEKTMISWEAWDDLVIASQMKRLGVKEIYSNDRDFDLIPDIKRVF